MRKEPAMDYDIEHGEEVYSKLVSLSRYDTISFSVVYNKGTGNYITFASDDNGTYYKQRFKSLEPAVKYIKTIAMPKMKKMVAKQMVESVDW